MKTFTLHTELWLPRPRAEVFQFFSDVQNLEAITPPWLNFEVLTPKPVVIQRGARIDYRIRVHGFPICWRTEITAWEPPHQFVDVQLSGPYKLWHHTHTLEEREGGTRCVDDVRYAPPGGALLNWLFVRRDVERIFQHRAERLREIFAAPGHAAEAK